ncbi:MFS transporter [Pseudomonas fluorescens group sp.]|uniref:Integral membrane protein n=2 Tax=Pseudomonas fluorescens TaxID=294 RepID=C3KCJ1_PSEFS|nr:MULTISPECIES: MFS transporter [Pseudomonas fluorescens group]MBZ6456180.1 MFS transporter [Pseudomonas fluorescens group sp.]MBZ6460491.1 MFS transporter [Pseudomonas fluorescens group sp.]MBZ6466133.1 MFS transporter [Pseudomonas fluorescens group sp.]WQD69846.1 MFS transporter [Pseudomonas marginalis]CAI2797693.1 Putative integral membrane protein [Pseudomonas fluorescens SBW25]
MRKDYLAFFVSLFLSRLADQILLFIVPLIVFQTTRSVAWAGLAFFVESLPRYLAFPVCGAVCDTFAPVRILHISQVYRALACVLAVALYGVFDGIYWIVLLSAVCGVLTTQGIMAREVLMPHIFAQYSYAKTLSYSQIADQSGLVLGPLVAALMLEVWAWHWVVLGVAGLFLLADLAMRVWQRSSTASLATFEQHRDIWLRPLKIAFGHIRRLPELKRVITLAVGVNLIIGVTLATSAAMVTGQFAAGKDAYALLQAAGALVTIGILFYLARAGLPLKVLGGLSYSMIGVGAVIMAISPDVWLYVVGFLLVTGFDKMFNVYLRSTRQRVIPVQDFGKTVGVITLLNNLPQPLAGLAVALLAAPLGTQTVILLLAAITALIGVAVASGWHATVKAELDVG